MVSAWDRYQMSLHQNRKCRFADKMRVYTLLTRIMNSFPLSHRETGGAWGIFINNSFSTALGLTFPLLLERVGGTNAFLFYGGLNIMALFLIFFLMPETKQRTLEELDYIYAVPVGKFASYQAKTWLPGMIKKHVFRQKTYVPSLYNLEEVAGGTHYTAVGH